MFTPRILHPRLAAPQSYLASDVADHYGFPAVPISAVGLLPQTWVAIIELGGGYSTADVAAYCAAIGCPVPAITQLFVDGAHSTLGSDADVEVALDMDCVIGATRGRVGLLMVWAPNTEAGFADAIKAVVRDGRACAISISWGASERNWTAAARANMDAAMKAALAAGIVTFAASGDDGSTDSSPGQNVDYPASSPYCVAVGGTRIIPGFIDQGWSYGGGGPSAKYTRPAWQTHSVGGQRGVPDVAANADPDTGYKTLVRGQWQVVGGTSASAPMLAAACAIITAQTGRKWGAEFIAKTYRDWKMGDVLQGSNGAYQAGPDFDFVTGAGIPTPAWFASFTAMPPVPPPTPIPPIPTPIPVPPPMLPPPVVPPAPIPPPVPPAPIPTCPTTVCQSVRVALSVFNYVRHNQEKMKMTLAQILQLLQQAGPILQAISAACPQQPAPHAINIGGILDGVLKVLPLLPTLCPPAASAPHAINVGGVVQCLQQILKGLPTLPVA